MEPWTEHAWSTHGARMEHPQSMEHAQSMHGASCMEHHHAWSIMHGASCVEHHAWSMHKACMKHVSVCAIACSIHAGPLACKTFAYMQADFHALYTCTIMQSCLLINPSRGDAPQCTPHYYLILGLCCFYLSN